VNERFQGSTFASILVLYVQNSVRKMRAQSCTWAYLLLHVIRSIPKCGINKVILAM
jgi:hypothetical protein